ncbi:MAG: hypothetical protein JWQ59_1230 [Cryobacterium sp.]|nr:hypothetical protein [Cryobacterium sp.]
MTATAVLRVGLAAFAIIEAVLGTWTQFFPESFYRDVPTVDSTPPFSEHLMRDFGGATLGLAVVLSAAAIWPTTRLVITALVAYLTFSVPHLAFHLGHLHGATSIEGAALTTVLIASVVVPLLLIGLAVVRARRPVSGHAGNTSRGTSSE